MGPNISRLEERLVFNSLTQVREKRLAPVPFDCSECFEKEGANYGYEGRWYCTVCWQKRIVL